MEAEIAVMHEKMKKLSAGELGEEVAAFLDTCTHADAHLLVERVLRNYYLKWWSSLPNKYEKRSGMWTLELRSYNEDVDIADVDIEWSASFTIMHPNDCSSDLPLSD